MSDFPVLHPVSKGDDMKVCLERVRPQTRSCVRALIGLASLAATLAGAANLVPNGNFSAGNVQFGSDYAFAAFTPCNNTLETQYTVGTNPATWNCNPVVVSVGDHTSGTGNMLIANGGDTAARVWFTSAPIPVVPNTNYFFEAWILNWSTTSVGGNAAQLTFRANSTDLKTASASGVGVWTPVSATWNSGSNTTVTLELFNATATSIGNDFAVDDIFLDTSSSIFPSAVPTLQPAALLLLSLLVIAAVVWRQRTRGSI